MPRITAVKVEAFNGPQDIARDAQIEISSRADWDLAHAVESDHYCKDLTTCDIAVALHNGFPLVAAGLLSGATECAHIDAVCFAHRFNKTLPVDPREDVYDVDEWDGWQEYFATHARMCEACGGASFDLGPGDDCGHCGATLLYQVGDEVEFYFGDLFPEDDSDLHDLITATVLPPPDSGTSLIQSGVIIDISIDPDFWLHVKDQETGEEYDIRASYLDNPIIKIGEDA